MEYSMKIAFILYEIKQKYNKNDTDVKRRKYVNFSLPLHYHFVTALSLLFLSFSSHLALSPSSTLPDTFLSPVLYLILISFLPSLLFLPLLSSFLPLLFSYFLSTVSTNSLSVSVSLATKSSSTFLTCFLRLISTFPRNVEIAI